MTLNFNKKTFIRLLKFAIQCYISLVINTLARLFIIILSVLLL